MLAEIIFKFYLLHKQQTKAKPSLLVCADEYIDWEI